MKLINLIPLREAEEAMSPDLVAMPYFREFQGVHGYKPLFKYLGTKGEEMIFTGELTNFGMLEMAITEANVVAKVTEKEAAFGVVCTTIGLEQYTIPLCLMKLKNNQIEHIPYDKKDKKNFDAKTVKFTDLIDKE